jgi:mono/diheme cytochrome c family protein
MKDWLPISLFAVLISAMTLASAQSVSSSTIPDTRAPEPHGSVASTTAAAMGASSAARSAAGPAQAAPDLDGSAGPLYIARDGNKVDTKTLAGWKTWRALACERCHGAEQEGLVGPSLVDSLKILTKEEFRTTIMNGRPVKGMPPFSSSKMVAENWEGLYAYLKGRSDGRINAGRLSPLDKE